MYAQNAQAETEEKEIILHPDQDQFIYGNWKYGWYTGEIGNGKTLAGILRAERLTYDYPRNTGMVLRKYWKDNRDTTLKQFHEILPEYEKYYTKGIHKFPNGSVIFWRGMDRVGKVKNLLNYNLGWYWLEQGEELWAEIFNHLQGRLKLTYVPLTGWTTSNPAGHNWLWELFHPDSAKKKDRYIFIQPPKRWNKNNLPENYYEEKERDWPKQMVDRFLNGLHEGYEGLLYYCLSEDNNVLMKNVNLDGGTFWEFQDYGVSQSNPMVLLNVHLTIDGKITVFDEFYKYSCMPEELAQNINSKRDIYQIKKRLVKSIACPATFQTESDGECPADKFKKLYGIYFDQNPCKFETRYPILFKMIKIKQLNIVFENCPHLLSEMRSLTWENLKTAEDHAIETLERGCEYLSRYINRPRDSQIQEINEVIEDSCKMETAGIYNERF